MRAFRWNMIGPSLLILMASASLALAGENAPATSPAPDAAPPPPFATVGDKEIAGERFRMAVQQWIQQKYYHGQVPAGNELGKIQRDVGDQLVDRILLVQEAQRLGLMPDQEELARQTQQYDQRYANSPVWQQNRDKMLAAVTEELASRSLLQQLEQQVRRVPEPTEAELHAFYLKHPEKFTEPEDRKLSLILLRVDPSAGPDAWTQAQDEANTLVKKLRAGGDFAELARIHSGDQETADKGGVMKKTHRGMLAPTVEALVDKMKPGEIADPITVLEGVAIFRLDKRVPPTLMDYDDDARKRAAKHLLDERGTQAWEDLKKRLRQATTVRIDDTYFVPLQPVDPSAQAPANAGKKAAP